MVLDQAQAGRLRSLPAVNYIDRDSLARCQVCDPRTVERRGVHEEIILATRMRGQHLWPGFDKRGAGSPQDYLFLRSVQML